MTSFLKKLIMILSYRESNNSLAVAGSDKIVYLYDSRMMKCRLKWKSPCKYDIVKLLPCCSGSNQLYVAGRDNEVLLCDIETNDIKVSGKSKIDAYDTSSTATRKKRKSESDDMNVNSENPSENVDDIMIENKAAQDVNINHAPLPNASKLRISHHR
jgi:hypothetical protein